MINIPKGTKDVLPQESYKWQYVESLARQTAGLFNAREIRTPVFEHTELFLRSIGDETDVVSKEMYTFLDKGERSITLKPEGTAPVARSFVENSLEGLGLPIKLFYITPVFRYEKPQHGRLREHHQFGVEYYGGAGAEYDFEVISLAYQFLSAIGISQLSLNLNSIGCDNCRGEYNAALRGFLEAQKESLCPTCRTRLVKNPLRVLDCKDPSCKSIVENAPRIIDYICGECESHMYILKELLTNAEIPFKIDPNIVRGLDYYTRTVFEFVTTALGSQGTVCGGGRYNNLVESIGGKPTPCVGFGMGIERLIMLIDAIGIKLCDNSNPEICIVCQAPQLKNFCIGIATDLRRAGVSAELDCTGRSVKAQFKLADRIKARYAVVIGDDEISSGEVSLKNMSDATIEKINIKDIANKVIQRRIKV